MEQPVGHFHSTAQESLVKNHHHHQISAQQLKLSNCAHVIINSSNSHRLAPLTRADKNSLQVKF